jgi:hypothetical protein
MRLLLPETVAQFYALNLFIAILAVHRLVDLFAASGTIIPDMANSEEPFHLLKLHVLEEFARGLGGHRLVLMINITLTIDQSPKLSRVNGYRAQR